MPPVMPAPQPGSQMTVDRVLTEYAKLHLQVIQLQEENGFLKQILAQQAAKLSEGAKEDNKVVQLPLPFPKSTEPVPDATGNSDPS